MNIDYVYTVEHFVQPGETISSTHMETFAGGKGLNQSIALAKAGAPVFHAGLIGSEGSFLKDTLSKSGVDVSMVKTHSGSCGHAIIQVDSCGQNCILLFGGTNQQMDHTFINEVLSQLECGDILLVQNEINLLPYIVNKSYEKGLQIALNPSPYNRNLKDISLEHIRWFILNEIEGKELTGASDPTTIVDTLLSRYPNSCVMLTLGKNGSLYADAKQRLYQEAIPVKAVDTTAAGDTFTGYFLAGLMQGYSLETVLYRAALASSIAVSRKGASQSIPTLEEVLTAEHALYK